MRHLNKIFTISCRQFCMSLHSKVFFFAFQTKTENEKHFKISDSLRLASTELFTEKRSATPKKIPQNHLEYFLLSESTDLTDSSSSCFILS